MKRFTPLENLESVNPIISQISFLGGLNGNQLRTVGAYFEKAEFSKGEYIARRGEEASHIYIIQKGEVALLIEEDNKTVRKRTFEVGDCFGEAAMLSLVNNTACFVALEDCRLIAFSRKCLNKLRRDTPEVFSHLMLNLARDLARKLQYTDEMLLHRPDPDSKS